MIYIVSCVGEKVVEISLNGSFKEEFAVSFCQQKGLNSSICFSICIVSVKTDNLFIQTPGSIHGCECIEPGVSLSIGWTNQ